MSTSRALALGVSYYSRVEFVDEKTAIYRVVHITPNVQPEAEKWSYRSNQCFMYLMFIFTFDGHLDMPAMFHLLVLVIQMNLLPMLIYCLGRSVSAHWHGLGGEQGRGYDIVCGPPISVALPPLRDDSVSNNATSDGANVTTGEGKAC
ncbi:hypothetical protein N7457_003925 [Penicillium paradoxum]|uniref:uncharacterized protein n=1 Tax=Penicillium paradoxum TaxID=176176 RepID=UPI002549003E|nr:uncharacterized protein N7457_003925 [Penicillium paradoxum]KAJ5782151.1 hypothetical protein N7457_003925 [Penicillium paradoxum]